MKSVLSSDIMVSIRKLVEKSLGKEAKVETDSKVSFFEMLTPAFAGGVIISVLLGIPGLNLLVFFVPFGGYFAVSLIRQYYEKIIGERDAAKVGAFAGIVGGFLGTLITMTLAIFFADDMLRFFRLFLDPTATDFILMLSGLDPYLSLNTLRVRLVVNVILGAFLGALGGIAYVWRMKSRP